jgi:hypothetical protein
MGFATLFIILSLAILRPAWGGSDDLERLAGFFEATVFGAGRQATLIATGPMVLELVGEGAAAEEAFLGRHAADLARLTGLEVGVRQGAAGWPGRPDTLQVHVLPRADFPRLLAGQGWIPPAMAARAARGLCFFVTYGRSSIRGGIIAIDAGLPPATRRHCLVEETTQALGPFEDSALFSPSALNDRGPPVDGLTLPDRLVLRTLYDPRLGPGLARPEAMARARAVLAELAAAVAAGGEEALDQGR